jgi:hypothetical protein
MGDRTVGGDQGDGGGAPTGGSVMSGLGVGGTTASTAVGPESGPTPP